MQSEHETSDYERGRQDALREAAEAVRRHDKTGREWVPGSLWDSITREAAARIDALKGGKR